MTDASPSTGTGVPRRTAWFAVGSVVLGIVAIMAAQVTESFSLLLSPVAAVMGKVAMNDAKASDGEIGTGIARLGFVIGVIGTVLFTIWFGYQAVVLSDGS